MANSLHQKCAAETDVTFHGPNGKTARAHRVVLASVSEFLGTVLGSHYPDFPLEDDVHISLADADFEAFRIVLAFAYGGVADIQRSSVESVCEVAQQLRIKFLKDCFVKINQKEYQESVCRVQKSHLISSEALS